MNHYLITLIHGNTRIVRNIVASSSRRATQIALSVMPEIYEPCAIICKPLTQKA